MFILPFLLPILIRWISYYMCLSISKSYDDFHQSKKYEEFYSIFIICTPERCRICSGRKVLSNYFIIPLRRPFQSISNCSNKQRNARPYCLPLQQQQHWIARRTVFLQAWTNSRCAITVTVSGNDDDDNNNNNNKIYVVICIATPQHIDSTVIIVIVMQQQQEQPSSFICIRLTATAKTNTTIPPQLKEWRKQLVVPRGCIRYYNI